jgi:hypothetical protein
MNKGEKNRDYDGCLKRLCSKASVCRAWGGVDIPLKMMKKMGTEKTSTVIVQVDGQGLRDAT